MKQEFSSLDMTQKTIAQSRSLVRAFDQPGNVCHDEGAEVAQIHNSQMRFQRCEWIVGNLRPGSGNRRDECRLARIRKSHQANIGEQF